MTKEIDQNLRALNARDAGREPLAVTIAHDDAVIEISEKIPDGFPRTVAICYDGRTGALSVACYDGASMTPVRVEIGVESMTVERGDELDAGFCPDTDYWEGE